MSLDSPAVAVISLAASVLALTQFGQKTVLFVQKRCYVSDDERTAISTKASLVLLESKTLLNYFRNFKAQHPSAWSQSDFDKVEKVLCVVTADLEQLIQLGILQDHESQSDLPAKTWSYRLACRLRLLQEKTQQLEALLRSLQAIKACADGSFLHGMLKSIMDRTIEHGDRITHLLSGSRGPDESITCKTESAHLGRLRVAGASNGLLAYDRCLEDFCTCPCHTNFVPRADNRVVSGLSPGQILKLCKCRTRKYTRQYWLRMPKLKFALEVYVNLALGKQLGADARIRIRQVVPFTSPAFTILYKLSRVLTPAEEGLQWLTTYFRQHPAAVRDQDPNGNGWVEKTIQSMTRPGRPLEAEWELLSLLQRLGAPVFNHNRTLLRCVQQIGEGPHLALTQACLDAGLEFSSADTTVYDQWPLSSDPDWACENITPDPFFLDLIRTMVLRDPSFGLATRLQQIIIIDSSTMANLSLRDIQNDIRSSNFYGQTAFHTAVRSPSLLKDLLERLREIFPQEEVADLVDKGNRNGTTPLMYAAAYNEDVSALHLLSARANPFIRDWPCSRSFSEYAVVHDDHSLLSLGIRSKRNRVLGRVLEIFRAKGHDRIITTIVTGALIHCVANYRNPYSPKSLEDLLRLIDRTDFTFPNSRSGGRLTLLHLVSDGEVAQKVLEKFRFNINFRDSKGRTPFQVVCQLADPTAIRMAFSRGGKINQRTSHNHNLLHLLGFQALRKRSLIERDFQNDEQSCEEISEFRCESYLKSLESIVFLLAKGCDLNHSDHCVCACSSSGCRPFQLSLGDSADLVRMNCVVTFAIVLLDWYLILEQDDETSAQLKSNVLELQRTYLFKANGLTHTCCNGKFRGNDVFRPSWTSVHDSKSSKCFRREARREDEELIRRLDRTMRDLKEMQAMTEPPFMPEDTAWIDVAARWSKILDSRDKAWKSQCWSMGHQEPDRLPKTMKSIHARYHSGPAPFTIHEVIDESRDCFDSVIVMSKQVPEGAEMVPTQKPTKRLPLRQALNDFAHIAYRIGGPWEGSSITKEQLRDKRLRMYAQFMEVYEALPGRTDIWQEVFWRDSQEHACPPGVTGWTYHEDDRVVLL